MIRHEPPLVKPLKDAVLPALENYFIDATVGSGILAYEILRDAPSHVRLLAIDADRESLARADKTLAAFRDRVLFVHAYNTEIATIAGARELGPGDAVIFDLGFSTDQLDSAEGFAVKRPDDHLDLRYDRSPESSRIPGSEVLNTASRAELVTMFRDYGDVPGAGKLSDAIIDSRRTKRIVTVGDFVEIIRKVLPSRRRHIDTAVLAMMALRIHVNGELENLDESLASAFDILKPGGILAVISFNSKEDRIVKRRFKRWATGCTCSADGPICLGDTKPFCIFPFGRRSIRPGLREIGRNPQSRAAVLRIVEKLS